MWCLFFVPLQACGVRGWRLLPLQQGLQLHHTQQQQPDPDGELAWSNEQVLAGKLGAGLSADDVQGVSLGQA